MNKIKIICALAENRVIGNDGKIPWYVLQDFKLFKEATTNQIVVMGRNTWESLPDKFRPLPNRINFVVSSTLREKENFFVVNSIHSVISIAKANYEDKDIFLIGGSRIYEEGLELADELYLSYIKGEFEGDTYFPEFNKDNYELIEEKEYEGFVFRRFKKI